jgi:hypothetical protein
MNFKKLLISKRNRKRKSAVKAVANGVHTEKLGTEIHLRRSPLWKQAREVRQHWFIV